MRKPCNYHLNSLWIARKRIGLGQKSVARLLGHKTISAVSEYETGGFYVLAISPKVRLA